MSLRFAEAAQRELDEASLYFETRERGLGLRFLDAVGASLVLIQENPRAWQAIEDSIRRCKVFGFPYGVIFTIDASNDILVIAVAHERRLPGYWRERARNIP